MKNPLVFGVMTFFLGLTLSCASFAILGPLPLNLRQLRVSDEPSKLEYSYQCCVKEFAGICLSKDLCTDYYDLSDFEVRQKLIDMDFVCHVREKP